MMRRFVGIAVLASLVGAALPARAEDDGAKQMAALRAELARTKAEVKHLREAFDQLTATSTRLQAAIGAMTNSMNASREHTAALQKQNADLQREVTELRRDIQEGPTDDPVRLRLEMRDAKAAHARDLASLHEQLTQLQVQANRYAVRATNAESELAQAEERHAKEKAELEARLKQAEGARRAR
jgi:chromosome segregation ATPase